jgi:3D-(3,5/4)-trihydroxycyclohexane-1,2-dione acylhydrolase (decyclizing)
VRVLTDPSACGPVTLALCQDVQTEAFDFPESFFTPVRHRIRRPQPDIRELSAAARVLERARKPLIIAGGGVLYSEGAPYLGNSPSAVESRSPKPKPARAPWPGTTRSILGASG